MAETHSKENECPSCGAEIPARESVCPNCQRRIISVPRWAQSSGARPRAPMRRWMIRLTAGLLIAVALWFNYPFIPNPVVLLFKKPSSDIASISSLDRWSMHGANPAGTNFIMDSADVLEGRIVKSIDLGPTLRSSPAIIDGVIYIGGHFKITAIEIDSSQTIWETATTGPVHGTPAVAGNTLYLGLLDKRILALDLENGMLRWEYKADAPFSGSVSVENGMVYAGSQDGYIYALDAESGRLLWKLGTGGSVVPPPAVLDGKMFAASNSGVLFVRNSRTGDKRLRIRTSGSLLAPPAVANGQLYLLSNGDLLAFDSNARELPGEYLLDLIWAQLWIWRLPVPSPPGQAGLKWRISPGEGMGSFLFAPAVTPEALYLGSNLGGIFALSNVDGKTLWKFQASAPISVPAMVIGQNLFVGTEDGNLYAFDRFSGQQQWIISLESPLAASLSFAAGSIYAHTDDGKLHIIR